MASYHIVETGKFKLDGGAMFGVVPKSMWSKLNTPDENNMCNWALRCLIIKDGNKNILIDAGVGHKQSDKFKGHFYLENITHFDGLLGDSGLTRMDITDVLLTHLHFDHVGGVTYLDAKGKIQPTFPNAKIWTNDYHYKWAIEPNEREKASFLKENILPLKEMGILHMINVEQGISFSESIKIDFVYGHTGAMMIPTVEIANDKKIIYCADLLPSAGHLGLPYVMSYDVQPLISINEKAELLEKANDPSIYLCLEHDPVNDFIQVMKTEVGKFNVR
jgi:glyoxylase-like metal-dependent hydrolase (beta-lactamase superfamily II)